MVVMGPAPRPTGAAAPTRMQLIVAGALLFVLLAVIGHLAAARVSRRLRTEPEIAAALGSPFLGTVDVPGEQRGHRPESRGSRARLRRLLGIDTRWDIPAPQRSGDEAERRIRYRRVCARLRDQLPAPRRLLVVVPEGDEVARRRRGQDDRRVDYARRSSRWTRAPAMATNSALPVRVKQRAGGPGSSGPLRRRGRRPASGRSARRRSRSASAPRPQDARRRCRTAARRRRRQGGAV